MKKWLIGLCIVVILGFTGYKWGMSYISGKVMDQIADQIIAPEEIEELKQDPEIKKIIEQNFTPEEVQKIYDKPAASAKPATKEAVPASAAVTAAPASAAPASKAPAASSSPADSSEKVMSKDEAMSFMLSKFAMSELKALAEKASDGLSDAEKAEIKSKLLTKLTPEEFEQIKLAALMELMKRDAS